MISEDVIAEIKRRADIGAIVGKTVKLKRVGRNLVGLCPFHSEKTPSFNVRPDEGFFYCFGCKAAGDVVEFIVRTTGRGFLDVISELAEQTGVEIPKVALDPEEEARQKERKRLLRTLEMAQLFFRTRLQADQGKPARAYLAEMRKIDDDTIDKFGIGYGGAADDGLVTFLKEQGVSVEDGVNAGVLGQSERGPYDFFRHRVTVPIRGGRGEILAFQGRIFGERETLPDGRKRPKYINGPQTKVYDKSVAMFGLFESLPALKQGKPAVLVEGPLDAIAVHRCGFPSAVAPCGTSLTPRHVDEIKKRTERVVVCTDADAAGKEAAARAILLFLGAGMDVGLVSLPDKDPDALVQAGRGAELLKLLAEAPSALDALLAKAREQSTGKVAKKMAAIDRLLPFAAAIPRETTRDAFLSAIANDLGADIATLRTDVDRRGRKDLQDRLRGTPKPAPPAPGLAAGPKPAPAPAAKRARQSVPFSEAETLLAEALLVHPHLAALCSALVPALSNRELRAFIAALVDLLVRFHDEDPRKLLPRVPMLPHGALAQLVGKLQRAGGFERPDAYLPLPAAARIVEDAILALDRGQIEHRLGEIQSLIADADERGDQGAYKQLLKEQDALVDAIRALDMPAARPLAPVVAAAVKQLPEPAPEPAETPPEDDEAPPPEEPPWAGDPEDDPWAG